MIAPPPAPDMGICLDVDIPSLIMCNLLPSELVILMGIEGRSCIGECLHVLLNMALCRVANSKYDEYEAEEEEEEAAVVARPSAATGKGKGKGKGPQTRCGRVRLGRLDVQVR